MSYGDNTRFSLETADKVARILEYLDVFKTYPYVKDKVCLHGGTALNLFVLEPERLSLDADINYIGNASGDEMEADRGKIEKAVCSVARELGYEPKPGKEGHAGRTFKLLYKSQTSGNGDFLPETDKYP